jgi:hypothetical protein
MGTRVSLKEFCFYNVGLLLALLASQGCNSQPAADASAKQSASTQQDANTAGSSAAAFALTDSDLDAYQKGLTKEIALVRAAQERGRNAKTSEERAKAAEDEWEAQTIPGGAEASELPLDRYRDVRKTVNRVFETLDFQGKIDGPLEIDVEHASADMKTRLSGDPFSELAPASAAALRAKMSKLMPVWVEYMKLTAVNG